MATQDDVRRIALSLAGTCEDEDAFAFRVLARGKRRLLVWAWPERVHPKRPRVPNPGVVAVRVADVGEKEALLASDTDVYFTEPHYDGHAIVLVRLEAIGDDALAELITDAWRRYDLGQ